MYRPNRVIETFEGEKVTCNIEGTGRRQGCYLVHFDCSQCENQSIADDEGFYESCNGYSPETDKTERHLYCLNYRR